MNNLNSGSVDVLLGLQWGDEGKGKAVDVLAPSYGCVARFQGGPNAGHSLHFGGQQYVLHTIPSGIFRSGVSNLIGNGVVLDPVVFRREAEALERVVLDLRERLFISRKAHLILPSHRALDAASERAKGKLRIGSTLKGIGPTYMDKTGRNGLRVGDTERVDFKERYDRLVSKHAGLLAGYGESGSAGEGSEEWFSAVEYMRGFPFVDGEYFVADCASRGVRVLAEGAQGTMLDIDFGTYPYVTSSSTVSAGACLGLGVAPSGLGRVYGIVKAYCTRVGAGPFPTELTDEVGDRLRDVGGEYGSTTGRPRRCGWTDLVALRYAVNVNGVTDLIMTKSDVLSGMGSVKACVAYRMGDVVTERFPFSLEGIEIEPVYREFSGWDGDISACRRWEDLPSSMRSYIEFVEGFVGVRLSVLSVGPDREETIIRLVSGAW